MKKEKYKITGMSCAACQSRIEKGISKLDGVKSCNVSLLTNSMEIEKDDSLSAKDIEENVSKLGYKAELVNKKDNSFLNENNETKKLLIIFIISLVFLVPLFYLSFTYMNGLYCFGLEKHPLRFTGIIFILSSIIVFVNYRFFVNGTKALFHGGPNMDTLVMMGTGISYIYSFVIMIIMVVTKSNLHHHSMNLVFETSGMIPTLITIGKLLESISKGRTTNAIKSLLELRPKIAHLVKDDKVTDISSDDININDTVLVKPGEYFPIDGIIVEGYSSIDESSLTGESLPIDKNVGDLVRTGTINLNGQLVVKTTATGEETTLNKIVQMVITASGTKTKISRLTDKISNIFVPVVTGISLVVFVLWLIFGKGFVETHSLSSSVVTYAISRAISVLVISCPCALGLATPVAIMVASGKGARNGILYKSAEVMEKCGQIDIAVFDKTGTLTEGRPSIKEFLVNDIDENELLSIVYSIESKNNHPYGKAIVEYSKDKNIKDIAITNYKDLPGYGVEGSINKDKVLIVKESYLNENGIKNVFDKHIDGATSIYVLINNKVKGLFIIEDTIREDAITLINNLKSIGISTVLLTGDSSSSANKIGDFLGVNQVISNVLPNQKYEVIKELQKQGKVLMIGDGINDSVALTQADVGIAIGKGSDIAIESADVVLAKDSLLDVYGAIRLSKIARRNIIENLFWAFFYNVIMIPIAAGSLSLVGIYNLPPYLAALAMSLSSITVVLNALRINLYNIYKIKTNKQRIEYKQIEIEQERNKLMKIRVDGMMCEHCKKRVEDALKKIDEVISAEASLTEKSATFTISKDINESIIKAAIEDSGYTYLGIID